MLRKIKENETLADFYKSEKNNTNPILIAYIINAIYLTKYDENSQEFKNDVELFVKEYNSKIKIIALEPENMSLLSKNKKIGTHKLEGIGDDFIPNIVDKNLIDRAHRKY